MCEARKEGKEGKRFFIFIFSFVALSSIRCHVFFLSFCHFPLSLSLSLFLLLFYILNTSLILFVFFFYSLIFILILKEARIFFNIKSYYLAIKKTFKIY